MNNLKSKCSLQGSQSETDEKDRWISKLDNIFGDSHESLRSVPLNEEIILQKPNQKYVSLYFRLSIRTVTDLWIIHPKFSSWLLIWTILIVLWSQCGYSFILKGYSFTRAKVPIGKKEKMFLLVLINSIKNHKHGICQYCQKTKKKKRRRIKHSIIDRTNWLKFNHNTK